MRIDDIIIHSLGYTDGGTRVAGDVAVYMTMESQDPGKIRIERLTCIVDLTPRIQAEAALIGDAIRQIRRLPEIRFGLARLRFAKGLKPMSPFADAAPQRPRIAAA